MLANAMKTLPNAALAKAAVLMLVVVPLNPVSPFARARVEAYPYGTKDCIEGTNGPGFAFYLGKEKGCTKAIPSYPYLEIDIREWPIPIGEAITTGPDNWAFRCPSSRDSCAQAVSGDVVFDHSTDPTPPNRGVRSTGRYELKFQGGRIENGRFEIVCSDPCG